MGTATPIPRQAPRWQDLCAKAIDATFDADRRRVGERVALVFRWLFLIVLGALNNLNPATTSEAKVVIDVVLFAWAVMNVVVQVLLVRGYRPGKQFSLTTMVLDIFFATGLVYLSDGFNSPFFLALFLAVITNAVRFGATASFLSALVISFLYLFIGGSFTPANFNINTNATIGTMFLFLVVALATGYVTRELERERRAAVERAAQADSLRELSMNLVSDTDIKDVFDVLVGHAVEMTPAGRGRVILSSQDGLSVVAAANRDEKGPVASEEEALDERQIAQAAGTGEAVFSPDKKILVVPIASSDGATGIVFLTRADGMFTNQGPVRRGRHVRQLGGAGRQCAAFPAHPPGGDDRRYDRPGQRARVPPQARRRVRATRTARGARVFTPHRLRPLQVGERPARPPARRPDPADGCPHRADDGARPGPRRTVRRRRAGGHRSGSHRCGGGQRLAYRIVDAVHAAAVPTIPGKHLTFSIGVATYPDDAFTAAELVAAADQALHLAKREGKDRPCTFPQLVTEVELANALLVPMLAEAGPQIMVAVAHAVDHRSPITQGHSSRIVAVAGAISRRAGVSSSDLESLRIAAYLHDVGHMTLPTGGEGFESPGHPEEGERIVPGAQFAPEIVAAVRHHHERWDGVGGADGMAGEKIPLMAGILAATETYEALTAGRGCPRITPQEALIKVREGSGTEFDPSVVESLGRAVQDGSVELNLPDLAFPAIPATPEPIAAT